MAEVVEFSSAGGQQYGFCFTPTAQMILNLLEFCQTRGEIGVILGTPGVGKTTCFAQFQTTKYRVFSVRLSAVHDTPNRMVMHLAQSLGLPSWANTTIKSFERIVETLRVGDLLIIDEVQYAGDQCLNVLRDIRAATGCGVVIAGNHEALIGGGKSVRHMRAAPFISRIAQTLDLEGILPEDFDAFCDHYHVQGARARMILRKHATSIYGLRRVATIIRSAHEDDRPIELKNIEAAIALLGYDS